MARGTIYHITTDPNTLGDMSESDFYEQLDSLSADYVQDKTGDDAKNDLDYLKETLKTNNFDIREETLEDAFEQPAFTIHTEDAGKLRDAKIQFFSRRLEQLKSMLEKISPEKFATDTSIACELKQYIDDSYSDAVYADMGAGPSFHTIDRFLRNLEPGHTYYVSANTVLMH